MGKIRARNKGYQQPIAHSRRSPVICPSYKRRAARPTAATKPGMAVWMVPAPVEDELEAPLAPALLLLPVLLAPEDSVPVELAVSVSVPLLLPLAPVPVAEGELVSVAEPEVLPALLAPKMVVDPTVVVIVSLPEVSVETMGLVVIAELPPATSVLVAVVALLSLLSLVSVPDAPVVVEAPAPPVVPVAVEAPVSDAVADPPALPVASLIHVSKYTRTPRLTRQLRDLPWQ